MALRRLRMTGAEIAELLGMPLSTVSAVLIRIGLGGWPAGALEPANRYERERPGELVHVDVKKLGRITRGRASRHRRPRHNRATHTTAATRQAGWEFVHVGVDDATRLAYAEVLADEKATPRSASCAARSPSSPPRHHRRARDDRRMKVKWTGWLSAGGILRWVRVTDEAKRRPLGLTESAARLCPSRASEMRAPVSRPHPLSRSGRLASR